MRKRKVVYLYISSILIYFLATVLTINEIGQLHKINLKLNAYNELGLEKIEYNPIFLTMGFLINISVYFYEYYFNLMLKVTKITLLVIAIVLELIALFYYYKSSDFIRLFIITQGLVTMCITYIKKEQVKRST